MGGESLLKVTRRDFLKLSAGVGGAVLLNGYGPALPGDEEWLRAESLVSPVAGQEASYATTCGGCPAGCGLIVQTVGGWVRAVEGNPAHPLNRGMICDRGRAALQELYNPNRILGPGKRVRGEKALQAIDWDTAIGAVSDIFRRYKGHEIAFLLGLFPDHLHDLTSLIARGLGGANVLRFDILGELDQRVTLMDACRQLFGISCIPSFGIQQADVIFSFGAGFTESWLSSAVNGLAPGDRWAPGKRGYRVQFESRRSRYAANADEWIEIAPGSDAFVALALAALIARRRGDRSGELAGVDVSAAALACGVSVEDLERLARMFDEAERKVAIPGRMALGSRSGSAAAEAILFLNAQVNVLGVPGGVFIMPEAPVYPGMNGRPSTAAEVQGLIARLNAGQIKAVLIHGANLACGLPAAYGFAEALNRAEQVISFSPYRDELSEMADMVLPDHMPLESWGYQKVVSGADRMTLSGLQQVTPPLYHTRATADILLAAARATGGVVAQAAPFANQVDFIQHAIARLCDQGGIYHASMADAFWSQWSQNGGWWKEKPGLVPPVRPGATGVLLRSLQMMRLSEPAAEEDRGFLLVEHPGESSLLHLLLYPDLDDRDGPNRLASQQSQYHTTAWSKYPRVEIHPETAQLYGLSDGVIVEVASPAGKINAIVSFSSSIRKDTVAMPLWQSSPGHGDFTAGRGARPFDLIGIQQNEAGSLAFTAAMVTIKQNGDN